MFNLTRLGTYLLTLQGAFNVLLNKMVNESDSQSACIISDYGDTPWLDNFVLDQYPTSRIGCILEDEIFIERVRAGVSDGCAFFIISHNCIDMFLHHFRFIHDFIEQRYLSKYVTVVGGEGGFTEQYINELFNNKIMFNDLPRSVVLSLNGTTNIIDIYKSYPFADWYGRDNQFFLENGTLEVEKSILPVIENFYGRQMVVAMLNYPPYTWYSFVAPGTGHATQIEIGQTKKLNLKLDGQECRLIMEYCKRMNCTIGIQFEEEGLWGESFHNHTGYGLVGALIDRRADIAIGAMYLWWPTFEFCIYSLPIQGATVVLIVPKPLPLAHFLTPLLPFPPVIWALVMSTVLSSIIMFHITKNRQSTLKNEKKMSLFDSAFNVLMMSMFQAVEVKPRIASFTIVFIILAFLCLICDNLYTGGLASIMTVTRFEAPLDTVKKLLVSPVKWGSNAECWLFSLQGSDIPEHVKFVREYKIYSAEELIRLEEQRKIATVLEVLQGGYLCYKECINMKISTQYMVMKEPLYWQTTQVYGTKTWPYGEQINQIITHIAQSGIAQYWEYKSSINTMDYKIQRNIDENGITPDGDDPVRLSIEHILGELIILTLGYTGAFICFIVEIVYFRRHNKTKQQHQQKRPTIQPKRKKLLWNM